MTPRRFSSFRRAHLSTALSKPSNKSRRLAGLLFQEGCLRCLLSRQGDADFTGNDTSLVFQDWAGGCSLFSHRPGMTMPCKLVCESQAPVRFYDLRISAGFPSPAQDYEEPRLHLNDLLIKNPVTTPTKANGVVTGAGIHDGDMLVVDRGLTDYRDKVVIA